MKNKVLQKELINLLEDRFTTSESVLTNFSKGEDAYDPIKPQAVVFPDSNEELSKYYNFVMLMELLLCLMERVHL